MRPSEEKRIVFWWRERWVRVGWAAGTENRKGKRREALLRILVRVAAALGVGGMAWRRVMMG